ncbi:MAG: molybdenum ABC transporter ATP-binding protein [Steroidobacteraceae bacterium]|jgi:molybdate transport system ATP-binding protein
MSLAVQVALRRPDFSLRVDCDLDAGGVTALFGPSGCGKTTLLRCIAGLDLLSGARVRFNDEVWQDGARFVPTHRRSLGYVFQESSLFAHLNVRGNLEYALHRVPARQRRVGFDAAVALLGLEPLLAQRTQRLSGGERQRVAIARALLTSPRLLLMDEPLSSLDQASKAQLLPQLEGLRDQLSIPVIYVSHSLGEVMRLADHMVLLEAGGVQARGALQELLTRTDLPLGHGLDAGTVIDAVIEAHDTQYHLSVVAISGGRLAVSMRSLPLGSHIRVRIDARDVSLALKPAEQTSITNVLAARVLELHADRDPAQMLVKLQVGADALLARITRRSVAQLGIAAGCALYAQIKSVALME